MWTAFKNVDTGTVHAVSLPKGMSPHGFAMDWPLAETKEPLTCPICLKFAFQWCGRDTELQAMLPGEDGEAVRNMVTGFEASSQVNAAAGRRKIKL
jgi:hypothetical protein